MISTKKPMKERTRLTSKSFLERIYRWISSSTDSRNSFLRSGRHWWRKVGKTELVRSLLMLEPKARAKSKSSLTLSVGLKLKRGCSC